VFEEDYVVAYLHNQEQGTYEDDDVDGNGVDVVGSMGMLACVDDDDDVSLHNRHLV
jgi:hypothetical protein